MKPRILFLSVIALLLAACSSDSDSVKEEKLLGKWYFKGAKLTGREYQEYQHECPTAKDYQEVLSSHEMRYYAYGTDCTQSESGIRFWSLEDGKLTVTNPDPLVVFDNVYKIVKLTNKELTLRIDLDTPTGTDSDFYYYTRN